MNKEQTITFWMRCEEVRAIALAEGKSSDEAHSLATDVWNGWAMEMLRRKAELQKNGVWKVEERKASSWSAQTHRLIDNYDPVSVEARSWLEEAALDFSGIYFIRKAVSGRVEENNDLSAMDGEIDAQKLIVAGHSLRFDNWIFPSIAGFGDVDFCVHASFQETEFYDVANFFGAHFHEGAWFKRAKFQGASLFHRAEFDKRAGFVETMFQHAMFYSVKFSADAQFYNSTFLHPTFKTTFALSKFHDYANFRNTHFAAGAEFYAVRSESGFSLEMATFDALPDFVQASFKEAPRLDHIKLGRRVPPGNFIRSFGWEFRSPYLRALSGERCSKDATSKYRALKSLAIDSHDHEREYLFFKGSFALVALAKIDGGTPVIGLAYYMIAFLTSANRYGDRF